MYTVSHMNKVVTTHAKILRESLSVANFKCVTFTRVAPTDIWRKALVGLSLENTIEMPNDVLLHTALVRKVMQSAPSVRSSAYFHSKLFEPSDFSP